MLSSPRPSLGWAEVFLSTERRNLTINRPHCFCLVDVGGLLVMNAAVQLLRESPVPMNTREIVAAALEAGLWEPTGSKTPEQSLYGSIFREIATKERPRIVRADQKGKFRIAE